MSLALPSRYLHASSCEMTHCERRFVMSAVVAYSLVHVFPVHKICAFTDIDVDICYICMQASCKSAPGMVLLDTCRRKLCNPWQWAALPAGHSFSRS